MFREIFSEFYPEAKDIEKTVSFQELKILFDRSRRNIISISLIVGMAIPGAIAVNDIVHRSIDHWTMTAFLTCFIICAAFIR